MRWLVAASLVVSLGASLAWAKTVRVFAVGSKLEVRYAETYQNFHDKMFAPVDVQHPRRSELVQADPDDVVSHLRGADRNAPELALVNFPEDVGVVAGLIGTGGALARRAATHSTGVQAAFFTLATNYAAQIEYYRNPFPRQQSIHYLLLAETATFYRSFYETFRDLAHTYGMYVTATANVAPHIRAANTAPSEVLGARPRVREGLILVSPIPPSSARAPGRFRWSCARGSGHASPR